MNHSNARRNSSGTSTSSPTRFDQVYPRWRGHSMPPGTVTYSDWTGKLTFFASSPLRRVYVLMYKMTGRPSGYEISHNAIRHHEVPAPNYASLPQSTLNSASSSSSAPATYWPQPTAVPSIHSQCPPTSYPDQPRSPGPYKSSALTRHNTAPEHGSQMAWPSAEVKDQSSVVRNLEFRRDVHQEPPVSHLPYTTQAYGSSETTSSMPVTTSEPIEERFNAIMPYSQSLAYPAYQPVLADYYGRYSP